MLRSTLAENRKMDIMSAQTAALELSGAELISSKSND
jgi:hypothetical protein